MRFTSKHPPLIYFYWYSFTVLFCFTKKTIRDNTNMIQGSEEMRYFMLYFCLNIDHKAKAHIRKPLITFNGVPFHCQPVKLNVKSLLYSDIVLQHVLLNQRRYSVWFTTDNVTIFECLPGNMIFTLAKKKTNKHKANVSIHTFSMSVRQSVSHCGVAFT